jgi:hypothetical protein
MESVVYGAIAPAEAVDTTASGSTSPPGRPGHQIGLLLGATTIVAVRIVSGLIFSEAARSSFRSSPYSVSVHSWTTAFLRWDSNFFIGIAQHGYTSVDTFDFLPIYPLLVRAVSPIFGYAGVR